MYHVRKLITLALIALAFTLAFTASAHSDDTRVVKLTCDYDKALETGKYDWVHVAYEDATAPETECKEKTKVTLRFFQIDKEVVSYDDAMEEINSHNCDPATWEPLFALGAQYPEFQRDKHIAAIGTIWSRTTKNPKLKKMEQKLVSYLDADTVDGRNLGMDNAIAWSRDTYFAAVCSSK